MNNALSLAQLKFDVWLIEQLQIIPSPGPTLEELQRRWLATPGHIGGLSRDKLTTHRHNIRTFLGVDIQAPDRLHYRIMNPEALALDSLANDLLKSIQNYVFLQEYKELGDLIQPEQIETGSRYLQQIGQALRNKQKLHITYQKFTDTEPYDAIVHPYCLKADKGRWYILAHKEGSTHSEPVQCFALDRTKRLALTSETFAPNPDIDVSTYFRDCYGIWHEFEMMMKQIPNLLSASRIAWCLPLLLAISIWSMRNGYPYLRRRYSIGKSIKIECVIRDDLLIFRGKRI